MLCCWVKIFYYLLLIGYHVVDVFFDWYNYIHLFLENTASGVSNATNSTVVEFFFVFSCAVGSFISLFLVVVYVYYIKHHWYCITTQATEEFGTHTVNSPCLVIVVVTRNATTVTYFLNYCSRCWSYLARTMFKVAYCF